MTQLVRCSTIRNGPEVVSNMKIPLFIPLARERAESFRKGIELFLERHGYDILDRGWHDFWMVLRPFNRDPLYFVELSQSDIPLVVENALIWANTPPAPVELLPEARLLLDSALADWHIAWAALAKILNANSSRLSNDHWLRDVIPLAFVREHQAKRSLAESWPVPGREEEKNLLAEMEAGAFIELDDTFARISGISKDEWIQRINQRKGNLAAEDKRE